MGEIRLDVSKDLSAWIEGFDELAHGPSDEMIEEWEAAARWFYGMSQAIVHVVTGRLKASGGYEVDVSSAGMDASLVYDTPYAVYEHERGGPHSWIDRAWRAAEPVFEDALPKGWTRTVRSWR